MEFRLYKTKPKLSLLLSSNFSKLDRNDQTYVSQQDNQSNSLAHHFYILIFKPTCSDTGATFEPSEGFESVWFNRNNGDICYKKSKFQLNLTFLRILFFFLQINNFKFLAKNLKDYQELGKVYGYIGKFQINESKILILNKVKSHYMFMLRCIVNQIFMYY